MFVDLTTEIGRASRAGLPNLRIALARAVVAGAVNDQEHEELDALIRARTALPAKPALRRVGSRPRTSESLLRRRRWAASGRLPPQLACQFTQGEAAVLAVIAEWTTRAGQVVQEPIGKIAAIAGVCETIVRNALRNARALGLLTVEEVRLSYNRNEPNRLTIISAEWLTWLRLSGRPPGVRFAQRSDKSNNSLKCQNSRKAQKVGRNGELEDGPSSLDRRSTLHRASWRPIPARRATYGA